MIRNEGESLAGNLVLFCDTLRSLKIRISYAELLDAAEALTRISVMDKESFYYSLRTTLVKDKSLFPIFDRVFHEFWSLKQSAMNLQHLSRIKPSNSQMPADNERSAKLNPPRSIHSTSPDSESKNRSPKPLNYNIYSASVAYSHPKFRSSFEPEKMMKTRLLVRKFKRRFSTRPGRRVIVTRSGSIDLALSVRRSVRKRGSWIELLRTANRMTRSKFVVLADISGSMGGYSDNLCLLLYTICNICPRTEVFLFSTDVIDLTESISFWSLKETIESISKHVQIWGSGTRIGECFCKIIEKFEPRFDNKTVVIIISDGWDLGDPEKLRGSMGVIRKQSSQVIWLNPLAKSDDYSPTCIGMRTAMPFVDVFAPTDVFFDTATYHKYFGISLFGPARKEPREMISVATRSESRPD